MESYRILIEYILKGEYDISMFCPKESDARADLLVHKNVGSHRAARHNVYGPPPQFSGASPSPGIVHYLGLRASTKFCL